MNLGPDFRDIKTEPAVPENVEIKLEPPSSSTSEDENDEDEAKLDNLDRSEAILEKANIIREALCNLKNETKHIDDPSNEDVLANSFLLDEEHLSDTRNHADNKEGIVEKNTRKKSNKKTVKTNLVTNNVVKKKEESSDDEYLPSVKKTKAGGKKKRRDGSSARQGGHACTEAGCLYIATRKQGLKKHIESKHLGIRHECDQCDFKGATVDTLRKHKIYSHSGVEYKCEDCDYSTRHRRSLVHHIKSKHEGKILRCDFCDYSTCWNKNLKDHIGSKHLGIKHTCEQCEYSGPTEGALRLHVQAHHSDVVFRCDQCDYSSKHKSVLRFHIQSKHIGKSVKCPLCDYTTVFKCYLRTHIESKHMGTKYKCDECEHESPTSDALNKHKESQHSNRMFICTECSFATNSMSNLRRHTRETHQEKKLKCDKCCYTTSRRKYLRSHFEKEHDTQQIQCPHCNKIMIHNLSLKKHIKKVHAEVLSQEEREKMEARQMNKVEIRCKHCDKLYTSRFNLRRHMKNIHQISEVPDTKSVFAHRFHTNNRFSKQQTVKTEAEGDDMMNGKVEAEASSMSDNPRSDRFHNSTQITGQTGVGRNEVENQLIDNQVKVDTSEPILKNDLCTQPVDKSRMLSLKRDDTIPTDMREKDTQLQKNGQATLKSGSSAPSNRTDIINAGLVKQNISTFKHNSVNRFPLGNETFMKTEQESMKIFRNLEDAHTDIMKMEQARSSQVTDISLGNTLLNPSEMAAVRASGQPHRSTFFGHNRRDDGGDMTTCDSSMKKCVSSPHVLPTAAATTALLARLSHFEIEKPA